MNIKIQCLQVGNIMTNCWIYPLPHESSDDYPEPLKPCAVVDPGAEHKTIIKHLKDNDLYPKYILLTHGHYDHVTALPELLKVYKTTVAIHKDEPSSPASSIDSGLDAKDIKLLSEGDTIGQFTLLHIPGHTPGSAAFYDEANDIMFTGDTLFCGNCGRIDLPGGDEAKMYKSLERLLAMKPGTRVLPGHGPVSTIAEEAARGLQYFIDLPE